MCQHTGAASTRLPKVQWSPVLQPVMLYRWTGENWHMESSMKGFVDDIESTEHFAGKTTE